MDASATRHRVRQLVAARDRVEQPLIHNLQVAHVLLVAQLIRGADGRRDRWHRGLGARGTGRGGVSTRRGACAVPGGGKDEKLFAKDMRALRAVLMPCGS